MSDSVPSEPAPSLREPRSVTGDAVPSCRHGGRTLRWRVLFMLLLAGTAFGWTEAQGLTVWTTYQGATLSWLHDEAASFQAAFGTQVEVVPRTLGQIKLGAMVEAAKRGAADLFVGIPDDQFSALAAAGILADMASYATPSYLAGLSVQARLAFRYDGKLYGLPLSIAGPALLVNTDLVPAVPASYQQFVALARSLTGQGRLGFAFDASNFYYAYAWIRTFGGSVFGRDAQGGPDPSKVGLDSPGAIAGAAALRALRFDDALLPARSDYAALHQRFLHGTLAMTYDGPWAIAPARAAGIPVAAMPLPPLADGTPWSGFMNVDGVLLNRYSRDAVAAANLAKWFTTVRAQVALARRAGLVPASREALAELPDAPVVAGFGAALAHARAIPNVPAMGGVWGPMDRALRSILASPDSDIAATLRTAAAAVRRVAVSSPAR